MKNLNLKNRTSEIKNSMDGQNKDERKEFEDEAIDIIQFESEMKKLRRKKNKTLATCEITSKYLTERKSGTEQKFTWRKKNTRNHDKFLKDVNL